MTIVVGHKWRNQTRATRQLTEWETKRARLESAARVAAADGSSDVRGPSSLDRPLVLITPADSRTRMAANER